MEFRYLAKRGSHTDAVYSMVGLTRTLTCVDTAGEHAAVASVSRAMKEHATHKEDVTHDSHRRIDGQN